VSRITGSSELDLIQARRLALDQPPRAVPVLRGEDTVPVSFEVAGDDVPDERLVVDYEHGAHPDSLLLHAVSGGLRVP
jgi:hypothetical protein